MRAWTQIPRRMIDKTRTFKRWTPGKSAGRKLSETKGERRVSSLTRQSKAKRESWGSEDLTVNGGALWEQVASQCSSRSRRVSDPFVIVNIPGRQRLSGD